MVYYAQKQGIYGFRWGFSEKSLNKEVLKTLVAAQRRNLVHQQRQEVKAK